MRLTLSAVISMMLGFAVTGHAQYDANRTFPTIIDTAKKAVAAAEMVGNALNQTNHLIPAFIEEFKSIKEELRSLKEQFYTSHVVSAGTALTAAIIGMVTTFMIGRHIARQHSCCSENTSRVNPDSSNL